MRYASQARGRFGFAVLALSALVACSSSGKTTATGAGGASSATSSVSTASHAASSSSGAGGMSSTSSTGAATSSAGGSASGAGGAGGAGGSNASGGAGGMSPLCANRWIVDAKGETVKDTMTGLTWAHDYPAGMDWNAANAYCTGLMLAGGGWKMPSLAELETLQLVNPDPGGCYIATCAFPQSCKTFWSSTPGVKGYAYSFAFDVAISAEGPFSMPYRIRCVR